MPLYTADLAEEIKISCTDIYSIRKFPMGIRLSRNFILGDVSRNTERCSQISKISENEVVCNLRHLSINCLDAIKDKYSDMRIVTGNQSPMPNSFAYAYNRGQAVLMHFPVDIVPIAKWIQQNVNYSQMMLVYNKTTGNNLSVLIGISYGSSTGIPPEGTVLDGVLVKSNLSVITPKA